MNYLPFCGYWFYGAATAQQIACFYCSYGLLSYIPGAFILAPLMMYYKRMRTR
jgi:hypothetical protein